MKQLEYRVTTLTPLLISQNSGDPNTVASKEYIPGSAILGLTAWLYIQEKNLAEKAHTDQFFRELFLSNHVSFGNAYIMTKTTQDSWERNFPLPLSLQKKKYKKINDVTNNEISDLLFNTQQEQTKVVGGYGRLSCDENKKYLHEQKVSKSLNFHHSRSSETGVVADIFNYESIDAGQVFSGLITGDQASLETIKTILESKEFMSIGRSRHAQYGQIKIELQTIQDFQGEIKLVPANPQGKISLTLLSPAILYNKNGFSEASETLLQGEINRIAEMNCKIKKSFFRTTEVESYVSVWNMPRPSETAFAAGSCFLFSSDEFSPESLKSLLIQGVGERRNEGFGRVALNWQQDSPLTSKSEEETPERGKGSDNSQSQRPSLPKLTKGIVAQIVAKEHDNFLIKKAIEEAKEFTTSLPSKSLIAKLEALVASNSSSGFLEALKKFPEQSKEKLRSCTNGRQKLLEYLEAPWRAIQANSPMPEIEELKSYLAPPRGEEEKTKIDEDHFKTFFGAFFTALRHQIKQSEQKGAGS